MAKEDEKVLSVPKNIVMPQPWQGITTNGLEGFEKLVKDSGQFKRRGDVEEDPNWKQIIPYMVYSYKKQFFLMQRTDKGGEARLYNNFSLGIGGHMRKEDLEGETIMDWAKREFVEEVSFNGKFTGKPLGLLNDDSNAVGGVHLGYVILLEGDSDNIKINDEHQTGELKTLEEIQKIYPQMETWSQIVFDFLKKNG